MADNRIQYMIDIIADDKKLRQQLAKINWEEIIGAKGNGFSNVLKNEAEESKEVIKSTLGGLHLDWSNILDEKGLKRLETSIAKVVSANKDKIKGFAKEGDVSGVETIITRVSALGDELKALGSSFDVPSLARSMTSFMKLIMPLSAKFDELAKAPEKISVAFSKIFDNTSGITQMAKSVDRSLTVYAKLDKITNSLGEDTSKTEKKIEAYQKVLDKLSQEKYAINISSLGVEDLEKQFHKINDSLIDIEYGLDGLDKKSEEFKKRNIKRYQSYMKLLTINKRYGELTGGNYLINDDLVKVDQQMDEWRKQNPKASIQELKMQREILERASSKENERFIESELSKETSKLEQRMKSLQQQTDKISEGLAKAISEQLSNIQIQLSINDQEKKKIVDEINNFIDNLNSGAGYHVNKINLGASAISTGFVELTKDEALQKLQDMQTGMSAIFGKINGEIEKNQQAQKDLLVSKNVFEPKQLPDSVSKGIYNKYEKQIELLTRQKEAYVKFEKEITGEKAVNLTASEVSDLYFFYQQMDNLEYKRDLILENTRKWRQEMVDLLSFKGQNLELDFDIEQITKDALFQEIQSYFEENPIKVHINAGTIDGATDGKNITINGGGVNLDPSTLSAAFYDAIQALVTGDVSKLKPSDKPTEQATEGSKAKAIYMDPEDNFTKYMVEAVDKLANEYADKDTVAAKKIKSFFSGKGLDLEKIQGKPIEIIDALSVMMEKSGNTLLSSIDDLIKGLGGKNKTLSVFKEDVREMLRTYNIQSEDGSEALKRKESIKVFQDFLMRTDFRSGVNKMTRNINKPDKWKAPDVGDVNALIAAANKMFANAESNAVSDVDKERVKSLWGGLINGRTEGEGESAVKYYGLQDIMEMAGAATTPEDKEVLRQAVENFREGARGVMQSLSAYIKTFDFTALINGVLYRVKANADGSVSGRQKAQRAIKGDESRIENVWITSDPSTKPIGVMGRRQEARLMATYGQKDSLIRPAPNTSDIKFREISTPPFQPKASEARKATQNEILGIEEDAKVATERREAANKIIVAEEKKQIENALETDKVIEKAFKEAIKERGAIQNKIAEDKSKLDALGVTSKTAEKANQKLTAANTKIKEAQERKASAEQSIVNVSTTLVPDWERKDKENRNQLAKYRRWQNNPEKYVLAFAKEYTNPRIEERNAIILQAKAQQKVYKAQIEVYRDQAKKALQNGDYEAVERLTNDETRALAQFEEAKQQESRATKEFEELREISLRDTEEARDKWKKSFEEYTQRQIDYYNEETKKNGEDPRKQYQKAVKEADKDIANAQAKVDSISSSKEMQAYKLAQDIQQASVKEFEWNARISELEAERERNKATHADILARDKTRENIDKIELRIGELENKMASDEQERKKLDDYVTNNYTKKTFNSEYTEEEQKTINAYNTGSVRTNTLGQIADDTSLTSTPLIGQFAEEIQKVINSLFEGRAKLQTLSNIGFEADKSDEDLKAIAQKRLDIYNNGAEKIIDDLLKDSAGKGGQTIEKLTQFLAQNKNVDVQNVIGLINKKADKNMYNNGKFLVELSEVEKNINSFLNNNEDVAKFLSNEQVKGDSRLSSLLNRTDKDKAMDAFVLDFANNVIKQGQEFVKTHLKSIEDNISNQLATINNEANTEKKDLEALKAKADEAEESRTQRLRDYIATSLQSVKENNQKIKELKDPKEIALLRKENEDLLRSIGEINRTYKKTHKDLNLLSEEQLQFYSNSSSNQYKVYLDANVNQDKRDIEAQQKALYSAIAKREPLLTNRKATLLDDIRTATADGKDTTELEVELSAINKELAEYELHAKTLFNNNLTDVFAHDKEFTAQYKDSLTKIIALENEVDLMRAKGASQTDVNAKLSEIDSNKLAQEQLIYTALQKRQQELLTDITNATKEGKSTTELQEKLKVVNKQLIDLELNVRRVRDSKVGGIINDVDVRVLKEYNAQMQELIKKEQALALATAIGEGVDKAKTAVNQAKKRVTNTVAETKEDVAIADAENSNKAQALDYLAKTDRALRLAEEQYKAIQDEKSKVETDLEKIQSENYQTSPIYREHIDIVKNRMTQDYIYSDQYQTDKKAGHRKVVEELATYMYEKFGITDPVSRNDWEIRMSEIEGEYKQSADYKKHKAAIEKNAISESAAELQSITEATKAAINKINTESQIKINQIRTMSDDDSVMKSEMDKVRGGLDFGQMKQNFANFFTDEIVRSMHQGTRKSIVTDLREQLKAARKQGSGVSQEEIDKLQKKYEFYNTDNDEFFINQIIEGLAREVKASGGTDEDAGQIVEFLRNINPNKLSNVYDWFDQLEKTVGTEPMSEDAIRQAAQDNLIKQERTRAQEEINTLRRAQKLQSKYINKGIGGKIQKELSEIVYEHVMKQLAIEIQQTKGLDEGFTQNYQEKLKELLDEHVYNLVSNYTSSLHVEDMIIDGKNIREMAEQSARNKLAELEKLEAENAEARTKLESGRAAAMKYGNIGKGEVVDAKIIREQEIHAERLIAAKEKQLQLTNQIAEVEASGDTATEKALRTQLRDVDAMVERLQMIVDNRDTLLDLVAEERRDTNTKNTWDPEKYKLWLLNAIETSRAKLDSEDEAVKQKAQADIDRYTQLLQKVEDKIAQQKPEPKGLIDQFLDKVVSRLGGRSGGGVSIDGATDIATETTLRAIFDVLTGSDEAAGAELDRRKADAEARADEWRRTHPTTQSDRNARIKKTSNGAFPEDFDFIEELNKQADVVKQYQKGTKEYIAEQAKLYQLMWAYKNSDDTFKKIKNKEWYQRPEIAALGLDPDLANNSKKNPKRQDAWLAAGGEGNVDEIAKDFVNSFKIKVEEEIKKTTTTKKSDKTTNTTVSKRKSSTAIRKENLAKLNEEGQRLYEEIPKSINGFMDGLKTKTAEELKTEMMSLVGELSKGDLSIIDQLKKRMQLNELSSAYRRKRREEINPDRKLKSAEVNATISEELDKIITSKDLIITNKTNLANILSQMAEYGVGGSNVLKSPTIGQKGILDDRVALSDAIANGIESATGTTRPLIAVDEADYKNKMAYVDAVNKNYDAHNYGFAERAYYRKGNRSEQKVGYYGAVAHPGFVQDEGIHSHPTNNAYSCGDIRGIIDTRKLNKNYSVDRLITPDFVYELKGLADVSIEALQALSEKFKIIDSIGLPPQIEDIVTNSALYHFAQQSGAQYFKGQAVGNGEYADVTMSTVVPQETLDNLLKYIEYGARAVQTRKKITALEKETSGPRDLTDLDSYIEMAVLERYRKEYDKDVALKQQYINAAKQNPIVANAFKYSKQNKDAMRSNNEMEYMRASSAHLIQTALGRGWDINLLYPQLEDYIESTEFLKGEASGDSLLGKIKAALMVAKDSSVMSEILPLLKQYFGDAKLDYINDAYLDELLDLADSDDTGKIAQDLKKLGVNVNVSKVRKKKPIVNDDTPESGVTRSELEEIKKQVLASIPSIIAELVKGGMSQEEAAEKAKEEAGKQMQSMVAKAVAAEELKKRGRPKKKVEVAATDEKKTEIVKSQAHKNISQSQVYKDIQKSVNEFRTTELKDNDNSLNAIKICLDELSKINDKNSQQYIEYQRKLGSALAAYGKSQGIENGKGFYDKVYENLGQKGITVDPSLAITNTTKLSKALVDAGLVTVEKKEEKPKVEAQVEVKPEEPKKAVEEAAKTGEKPKVEVVPTVSDGNIQNIISDITDTTKGTANSFDGLIGKFKDVPTVQKMLQELRDLMVQIPSATGDTKDGLIDQTTKKANELVEKLVSLKKNRLLDLGNFFGKDVQSDSTHLLGVMKQIFEIAQKTRAEKDAQKETEKSITQENKAQKQEQSESKSNKTADKGGSGYNAFKDGAKVYSREIAQESTLQKILAKLNAGITTKDGGSNSAGGKSTNDSKRTTQQKSYATNKFTRAAETQRFNIIGATQNEETDKSILDSKDIAIVAEYNQQYSKLIELQEEFNKTGSVDDEVAIKNLRTKSAIVKELGKEVLATARKTQNLNDAVEQSGIFTNKRGEQKLLGDWSDKLTAEEQENIPAQLRKFAQEMYGADLAAVKVNKTTGKLTGTLRLNNYQVQDITVQYDKGTKMMAAFADKERDSLSGLPGFLFGLQEKSKAIIQYLASMTSIYRIVGMVRQGIQYIKEIDMALTELRKVTDETDETYEKFLKTASKTGSALGSTIVEVTQATATFARLGYSMDMASEMAKAALVYKNVGDGIASADDAADSIISTLKGFKLEATEAMRIVDRFNEVGK